MNSSQDMNSSLMSPHYWKFWVDFAERETRESQWDTVKLAALFSLDHNQNDQ